MTAKDFVNGATAAFLAVLIAQASEPSAVFFLPAFFGYPVFGYIDTRKERRERRRNASLLLIIFVLFTIILISGGHTPHAEDLVAIVVGP